MKYHIITYGCQMNKSDSERIAGLLEDLEFKFSPSPEGADLLVINICSVRQSAVDRVKSRIKNFAEFKIQNSKFKILLTGCILKKDKREFRKYCNGIFAINELPELPALLKKLGFKIMEPDKKKNEHYLQITPKYQSNISACVPIMTGCNNFCSYCVVPYLRGQEVSRPAKDILREVKNLVKKGVKEIWLLGQNVNSYKPNFAKLLQEVNDIEGDFWIRFTSSHPKDLSEEMIETFAKCNKAAPYFNLPIQSGDNEILKAMNRPYAIKQYKVLVKKLKAAFKKYRRGLEKELTLSTDVIVGFPGETKKQFKNTKKTFQEIGFIFTYISRYSPRRQTAASKLQDDVAPVEKKRRRKRINKNY